MSWTFWDTKRLQEANYRTADTFLRTGYRLCFDSDQCASGYACIGARCVLQNNENSNSGSCAGTTSTSYSEASNCPSGGSAGCTSAGCDSNADCPCGRCCRYDAYGNVTCYCGNCLKLDGEQCSSDKECLSGKCIGGFCGGGYCDIFCDIFYKNTNSYLPGCSKDNVCDECSECSLGNTCTKRPGAPCWCGSCPTGELCQENGLCAPAPNPGACYDQTACDVSTGVKCCKTLVDWFNDPEHCPDGSLLKIPCSEPVICETRQIIYDRDISTVNNYDIPCPYKCECEFISKVGYNCSDQFGGCTQTIVTYKVCCPPNAIQPTCTNVVYYAPQDNFVVPCPAGCTCSYLGFITADGITAHFVQQCCSGGGAEMPKCDCVKYPDTCNEQCAQCEECKNYECVPVTEPCPPITVPKSLENDTCFKGYYGYGCFTTVTFIDHDCCYFSNYRPDGDWTGVYIGGGKLRVTSCNGAYCDVPVGGIRSLPGNAGIIISNSQSGLVNCSCCNCSGTAVSFTFS